MGKVQYGGGITAITGSIGGWSFQTNRSGAIVRVRGGTLRNSTQKQTAAHQNLVAFQKGWQQLTSEQQVGWNVFADTNQRTDRYGVKKIITGLNWFASINYYLDLVGEPTITTAPAHTIPVAVQAFNLAVRTSAIILGFEPEFNPANNALLIFTTPYTSRITTSQRQNMRLTKVIAAGAYGTINLTSDWENTHGMTWPPSGPPICGYVGVMVQTVNKASGISSTALLKTNGLTSGEEGIGFMSIGNDFIVKANLVLDSSTQLAIDAIYDNGGSLSQNEMLALNTYVLDAKNNANPWWNNLDVFIAEIGGTKESFEINIKQPGAFNAIYFNTTSAEFTAAGWNKSSTSYFNTQFNPSLEMGDNNLYFAVYITTNQSGTRFEGGSNTVNDFRFWPRNINRFITYMFGSTEGTGKLTSSTVIATSIGNWAIARLGAKLSIYFNATLDASHSGTQNTRPNTSLYMGAWSNIGVDSFHVRYNSAGRRIGHNFTDAMAFAECAAMETLNATLSREN